MASGFDGLGETVEKHPALIALAVAFVAFLAWMQSRNQPVTTREYTFAGGGAARAIDPNAAAISEAAISAGVANLGAVAQLVGLQDSNHSALTASLTQTGASRDLGLAETEASRTTGLASISAALRSSLFATEANRDVSLAGIDAQHDVSNNQTAAGVTIATGQTAAQITAAQITANIQAQQIAAQRDADKRAADNQNFAIQADKDKARAAANAGIVNGVVNTVGNVISALNPFNWF